MARWKRKHMKQSIPWSALALGRSAIADDIGCAGPWIQAALH